MLEILSIYVSIFWHGEGILASEVIALFWLGKKTNNKIPNPKQLLPLQTRLQTLTWAVKLCRVTSNWKKIFQWRERKVFIVFVSLFCMWKQISSNNQGLCYLGSWQSFTRSSWLGNMNVYCWHLFLMRCSHKCWWAVLIRRKDGRSLV